MPKKKTTAVAKVLSLQARTTVKPRPDLWLVLNGQPHPGLLWQTAEGLVIWPRKRIEFELTTLYRTIFPKPWDFTPCIASGKLDQETAAKMGDVPVSFTQQQPRQVAVLRDQLTEIILVLVTDDVGMIPDPK